jgi:hypothetical protein
MTISSPVSSSTGPKKCNRPPNRVRPIITQGSRRDLAIFAAIRCVCILDRDQAADRINPRIAKRTASSRSRSIKRPPRNCSQATIRSRKTPRFSIGKPPAAFQIVRSCESDSANMRHGLARPPDVNRCPAKRQHKRGAICRLSDGSTCVRSIPPTVHKITDVRTATAAERRKTERYRAGVTRRRPLNTEQLYIWPARDDPSALKSAACSPCPENHGYSPPLSASG